MKDGGTSAGYDVPLGMLVANEALEVIHASPVFLRDFECTADDVVGLELSELIATQDRRSTILLDRKLSQAEVRRVDVVALLEIGGHTRLSRLALHRDNGHWLVVVEALDAGDNLVFELYNDQRRWSAAIKGSSDAIVFLDSGGRILEYNAKFVELMAFRSEHQVLVGEEALMGTSLLDLLDGKIPPAIQARLASLAPIDIGERFTLGELTLELRLQPLLQPGAGVVGHAAIIRDISDRVRAEAEKEHRLRDDLRHHEEVIAAQQRAIRELTAPLLPIGRDVTIVPFVGELDGARIDEIAGHVLAGVAGTATRTVVLDLTGVPDLDATATEGLTRLTQSLTLVGVRAVLTGIGPRIARSLSEQPVMRRLEIRRSLEDAVVSLLR